MRVLTGKIKKNTKTNVWNFDTHEKIQISITHQFSITQIAEGPDPHTTGWEYKPDHRSSVGKDPEDAKLRHLVVADSLPIPVNEEARRDHDCTSARAALTEKA